MMLKPISGGMSGLEEVLAMVLDKAMPSPREREAINVVGRKLLSKVEEVSRQACDIEVRPVMAG